MNIEKINLKNWSTSGGPMTTFVAPPLVLSSSVVTSGRSKYTMPVSESSKSALFDTVVEKRGK
jgi:hypothetical protein